MKNSNNLNFILEVFWLVVFVITLGLGIVNSVKHGFRESYIFLIMALLAFLLYIARRTLRLKNTD